MKKNKAYLFAPAVIRTFSVGILALAYAASAMAQQWRFEPILKVGAELDDNATLTTDSSQEVDLAGVILNARANIRLTSPTTSFSLQPQLVNRNYGSGIDSLYDSDEYFLRSSFRRRALKSTVGFRVNFEQQSIRRAERTDTDLEIEDPDEITDDATGRVQIFGDRTQWRLSPYWDYRLSDVSTIGASFNYVDTEYDDIFTGLLNDYTDSRLNLDYRRTFSRITSWGISVTGRQYDSKDTPFETDGYGVSGFIGRALSERTRVSATAGFEETDVPGGQSDQSLVGGMTLTHSLETVQLLAQYRRSVSASGAGTVAARDSLNLNFRRRLNQKLTAGLGARAFWQDGDNNVASSLQQDYFQLRASLTWYWTQAFAIEADYRYTSRDRGQTSGGSASSNQVNIWFVYQPRTIPRL